MLSKKKQEILHSLNIAARSARKTNDVHEWYYYHCKMYETFSVKELIKYHGLQNYSRTRRNSAAKDEL